MKICFILQRRFAYLGHVMALTFQKKYGIKKFCGYVHLRTSFEFLKSQNDIDYTQLLLDEDIHKQYKNEKLDLDFLKKLEKEYGIPNLWPYIEADRLVRYNQLLREYPYNTPNYTHEEMMRILQVKARAIIKFLEEEKPDVIIFTVIGGIDALLLYHIAKKKGIRTLTIFSARTENRYSVHEDYRGLGSVYAEDNNDKDINAECQRAARDFLDNFRRKPRPYTDFDYVKMKYTAGWKRLNFLSPMRMIRGLIYFIKFSIDYFCDKNKDDYSTIKPWHYLLDRIKRRTRIIADFGDLYDNIDKSEDYVFFPLQYEPEESIIMAAPFFKDQLWVIKQVACSLPLLYKLYVKEHPAMSGYRPRRYYKELKKIPNVKLIKPTIESFELIKNAKTVVTISATSGWEALLLAKPAITFGEVFYNQLSMVKRCRTIEELPYLIKEQSENFRYNEEELLNFLSVIYKESADANLVQLWNVEGGGEMDKKEKELIPLVDLIAKKLNLQQKLQQKL